MGRIPQKSTLRCAFCQGKGMQPGAERLLCIICRGSGRITVRQPYSICKECGGRGKKESATLYCLACHGKGVVEERRYLSRAESPISKRKKKSKKRRKGGFRKKKRIRKLKRQYRKSAKPKVRKSFFKKLLGFFEIL